MVRFRSSKEIAEQGQRQGQRKAPPNYFSRRVQYRLLLMVAVLMGVVLTIEKVADPAFFSFFGTPQTPSNVNSTSTDANLPNETLSEPLLARYGVFDTSHFAQTDLDIHQTYLDLWDVIFKRLTYSQRKLVLSTLHKGRQQVTLDDEHKTTWWDLYQEIDELFQKYMQQVLLSLNTSENALTDAQKARGLAVVATIRQQWNERYRKAFLEVLESNANTKQFENEYAFTQQIIDQLALSMLKDHSLFSNEDDIAWFRMLERLQQYDYPTIKSNSTARVSALELGTQQPQFRGQLVTVRGEIRKAYRVQAQKNDLGVKQYFVIIIKPTGGTLVPFVVYSLEAPANFPQLPDKNLDGQTRDMSDLVEVTGYFFKSWAHQGGDGKMHSSPLLLTRNFDWFEGQRLEAAAAETSLADSIPTWVVFTIPLTIAIVITLGVYLASIWNSKDANKRTSPGSQDGELARFNEEEVGPTVLESLRQLSQEELPEVTDEMQYEEATDAEDTGDESTTVSSESDSDE